MTGMTYNEMLIALQDGKKTSRSKWNNNEDFVQVMDLYALIPEFPLFTGRELKKKGEALMRNGSVWRPNNDDISATDWFVC